MAIYKGDKQINLYKGNYNLVDFYKGDRKILGYDFTEALGASPLTLSDVYSAKHALKCRLKSKNLFDCANAEHCGGHRASLVSRSSNSLTIRIGSGYIRWQSVAFALPEDLVGKTVTFRADWTCSGSNGGAIRIQWMKNYIGSANSAALGYTGISGKPVTCTISEKPSDALFLGLVFHADTDTGLGVEGDTVTYDNVQVEIGSEATEFMPYAINGFMFARKNLFDPGKLAALGGVKQEDGSLYFQSNPGPENVMYQATGDPGPLTLSYKVKMVNDQAYAGLRFQCIYTDGTVDYIGNIKADGYQTVTWTSRNGLVVDRIVTDYGSRYNATWIKDIQLEKGTSATAYEPYTDEEMLVRSTARVGKNLLPFPYKDGTKTLNGIKWTVNSDGTITANGTATADSTFDLVDRSPYNYDLDMHTISGCPSGGSTDTFYIRSMTTGHNDTGQGISLPLLQRYWNFRIYIKSGYTANNLVFKPQIESGSVVTNYLPYAMNGLDTNTFTITGKNLLPFPYFHTSRTVDGITFTVNDDGTITLNGTAEKHVTFMLYSNATKVITPVGQTVTISEGDNFIPGLCLYVNYVDANGTAQEGLLRTNEAVSATRTIPDTWCGNQIFLRVFQGASFDNVVFKPQIELGYVATPHEPYTAKELTTYAVEKVGKNIYNSTLTRIGLSGGNGTEYTDNTRLATDYISVEAGKTYVFSGVGDLVVYRRHAYDENKNWIGLFHDADGNPNTCPVPDGAAYIRALFTKSDNTQEFTDEEVEAANELLIQLEEGTVATEYEPYSKPTLEPLTVTCGGKNLANKAGFVDYPSVRKYLDIYLEAGDYYYSSNMHAVSGVTFYTGIIPGGVFDYTNAIHAFSSFGNSIDEGMFTITKSGAYRFLIYCSSSEVHVPALNAVWDKVWIQIERGKKKTVYEPYAKPETGYLTMFNGRKNIFPTISESQTGNGVTLSYDSKNDVYILNGTSTASHSFELVTVGGNYGDIKAGDSYTVSSYVVGGTESTSRSVWVFARDTVTNTNSVNWAVDGVSKTSTYNGDGYITRIAINVAYAGVTYNNFTFRVQLEKGTEATPYEPYWTTDGTVKDILSISPTMILTTNTDDVILDVEYVKN